MYRDWQTMLKKQIIAIYLVIALFVIYSYCIGIPCHSDSWWSSDDEKCIKCTQCENQLIVLRPCQLHQDTVCGTIHDLQIDWMLLTQTESQNQKHHKQIHQGHKNYETIELENSSTSETIWDWQSISLILAILACLLFFLVAAYVSLQHMRQWRRIEQRLNRDVEELSVKLMTRLAEACNLENGSFLIENPIKDQHVRPVEVHCIYLEKLSSNTKEPIKTVTQGNLYIEEAGSKG